MSLITDIDLFSNRTIHSTVSKTIIYNNFQKEVQSDHYRFYFTSGTEDENYMSLTGIKSVKNSNGKDYTLTIIDPLIYKQNCIWIGRSVYSNTRVNGFWSSNNWEKSNKIPVSGVVEIIDNSTNTISSIYFGNGSCDRIIEITHSDGTKETRTVDRWEDTIPF